MDTTKQVPLYLSGRLSRAFFICSVVTIILESALYIGFFMIQPMPYMLGLWPLIGAIIGIVGAALWFPCAQATLSEATQQGAQLKQPPPVSPDAIIRPQQLAASSIASTNVVAYLPPPKRLLSNTMVSFNRPRSFASDPNQIMPMKQLAFIDRENTDPSMLETLLPDNITGTGERSASTFRYDRYEGLKGMFEVESYYFIVPKEGRDPERCADKCAVDSNKSYHRYAIADGVSTSFIPGKWAELVSQHFVKLRTDFRSKEDFAQWLRICQEGWLQWVKEIWIPETERRRGGERDWSRDIANGAQTTFVGCSFSPQQLADNGHATVRVFAIGDSNFFLVHPPQDASDRWEYRSYPIEQFEDFGSAVPAILTTVTTDHQIAKAWRKAQENTGYPPERGNPYKEYDIKPGDYIILTTDALAEWILQQNANQISPWNRLIYDLANDDDFRAFVQEQRQKGMERDDTTMLVIHLKLVK